MREERIELPGGAVVYRLSRKAVAAATVLIAVGALAEHGDLPHAHEDAREGPPQVTVEALATAPVAPGALFVAPAAK
jgi:hypothetical protein